MTFREGFSIAIVGGGIGGLVCALSLAHHCPGVLINIYEQASEIKEIGAGIGIGVNAAKVLHRLGVGQAANKIAGDRKGVWISFRRWDNGGEIVTVPASDEKDIRQLPIHRAEFLDLLYETVKGRGIKVHTNKRCQNVTETGPNVTLLFEDGTTANADMVVGCDGIHSTLRSQFATDKPRYSGRIAYRGLVPISQLESWWPFKTYSASWLGVDKHFLVFPVSQNKKLNVVAFVAKSAEELHDLKESWTTTADRAEIEEEYKTWDETVRRTISLMQPRPGKWLINDRNPLEQWVFLNGKLVLMGDAAHAMLPHQGAGAGQAIEDGYILGRAMNDYLQALGKCSNDERPKLLARWTQVYQDVRLPRAQRAQRTARQAGEVYEMQSEDLKNKAYDACLPEVREKLKDRMKWIWTTDIDMEYEKIAESQRI